MTHNAPERHRHNNQRHHHYARSPVRSYYGVARAASRYNALNVVGSTLARLSPVPLRTTAHPHSSTIPQNIPQKGGHLSRSKSARIKACRYDRLSPRLLLRSPYSVLVGGMMNSSQTPSDAERAAAAAAES